MATRSAKAKTTSQGTPPNPIEPEKPVDRTVKVSGLEFERFGVECEINDELEDLAEAQKVKHKK